MRKSFLAIAITLFSFSSFAQFGVNAGYVNTSESFSGSGFTSTTDSFSGFSLGVTYTTSISDTFLLRPELHFASLSKDGESTSSLMLPIPALYEVADSFNLQFGPSLTYSLEKSTDGYTNLGISALIGAAYSFTDNVYVQARYMPQITNSYTGPGDFKLKSNMLSFSVGYEF